MTNAEKQHAFHARHSLIDRLHCADMKRRERLEKDPAKWLRFYLPQTFLRPFDKPHLEIIDGAMKAHEKIR